MDYVFKPPPEGSKSGVWNSIEMVVNTKRMDATKFGDESVQSDLTMISSLLDSKQPNYDSIFLSEENF